MSKSAHYNAYLSRVSICLWHRLRVTLLLRECEETPFWKRIYTDIETRTQALAVPFLVRFSLKWCLRELCMLSWATAVVPRESTAMRAVNVITLNKSFHVEIPAYAHIS